MKEMTRSGIFVGNGENGALEADRPIPLTWFVVNQKMCKWVVNHLYRSFYLVNNSKFDCIFHFYVLSSWCCSIHEAYG